MKHILKKTLALLLCMLMAFSCFVLTVSAATKETVPQFGETGGYLAIGDSIGKGCGADGSYIDRNGNPQYFTDKNGNYTDLLENGDPRPECGGQYNDNDWRYVQGCYAAQIADAVGCVAPEDMRTHEGNFWPCTFGGMTTAVALDLYGVDDGYSDNRLNYEFYDNVLKYFGYEGSSVGPMGETYDPATCGVTGNIEEVTGKASLITVELGMCDIFYRAYRVIAKTSLQGGFSMDNLSAELISDIVTNLVDLLKEGYEDWERGYPQLIDHIASLNSNATIVMVGSFNMLDQMTILDQTSFPLGSVFAAITDKMNRQYEAWLKEFTAKGYNIYYADINNTESMATEKDWSALGEFLSHNYTFPGTHPTQAGYDYITRQILGAIPPVDTYENITVDIGRFTADTVTAVYVNGIKVSDYEINDHILSVPYAGALATSMKLDVIGPLGTAGVQYYTLTHKAEGGYDAERQFGNNDIKGLILRPVELFKFLFETILGLLGIEL